MTKEDILLLQRCQETLRELEMDYRDIKLDDTSIKKTSPEHDIHLEIVMYESILKECKIEVQESLIDEIVETFKVVYHMDLRECEEEQTLSKLDQVTSKFLSSEKHTNNVNEEALQNLRDDEHFISGIKDILKRRIAQLHSEKKWFIFSQTTLIEQYEQLLLSFSALEAKILETFTAMSELVTTYIVESFHYIYLCFAYMFKYFKHTHNQLVLVEIAASIDRFIHIMQPLVKETSLKNENLRNFYVIYELNVLKDEIIEYYE